MIFATAHGADNDELDHWAALAGSGLTLALYMGKSIAGATASKAAWHAGMNPSLPIGLVVNAGRRDRSFVRGTLGGLASGTLEMADGPAVIFIGEAVAHGDWADAATIAEQKFKVA